MYKTKFWYILEISKFPVQSQVFIFPIYSMGFFIENIEIFGKHFMKTAEFLKFLVQNTEIFEKIGMITHCFEISGICSKFSVSPQNFKFAPLDCKFQIFWKWFYKGSVVFSYAMGGARSKWGCVQLNAQNNCPKATTSILYCEGFVAFVLPRCPSLGLSEKPRGIIDVIWNKCLKCAPHFRCLFVGIIIIIFGNWSTQVFF